jgi:autotransporter translocation and assembly factor TamB
MSRGVRLFLQIGAAVLLGLVILVLGGIFILTRTDWGRERVRVIGIGQLAKQVAGQVRVGKVSGNLLTGATLSDVFIGDSAGRPFLQADTVILHYSWRSFLSKHLIFRDVRLVRPYVTMDRPPGGKWNFERIFPQDTSKRQDQPGFGSWVRFQGMEIVDGNFVVRQEWKPDASLSGRALDLAIAQALSPDNRLWIVEVPGGYQSISHFYRVNAMLPHVRFADPDSANRIFDVARLNMLAAPFRPPVAQVRDLKGRFIVSRDTAWFSNVRAIFPGSDIQVEGAYAIDGTGAANVRVRAPKMDFIDLRFAEPRLPLGGGSFTGDVTVGEGRKRTHVLARAFDVRAEGAHVKGSADLQIGDQLRLGSSNIDFSGVDTRLIRRFSPSVPADVNGVMAGSLRLAGTSESLRVNGWTTFRERSGATSRIVANGELGTNNGVLETRALRLRFDPLRASLVRVFQPDFPLGGTINGRATLTGNTRSGFALDADVTHQQPGIAQSRVLANGRLIFGAELIARDLRLTFRPMQTELLRTFRADFPLAGTITGRATLNGSMQKGFAVDADLTHEQGGTGRSRVLANGNLQMGKEVIARNLRLQLNPLQVALVKQFNKTLPIDGVITGRATLNGPLQRSVSSVLDVTHRGSTGVTHAIGTAALTFGASPRFDVQLSTPVLSLATVGRFAPAAGLRGTAHGSVALRGALRDLALEADLAVEDAGSVSARGRFDLQSKNMRYDFTSELKSFNAAAISTKAPETMLTGTLAAVGTGTDPATARAVVRADLLDLRVQAGTPALDTTRVLVRLADGLATFDRGQVRIGSARADFTGSFGLVEGRTGQLRYTLVVDSLAHFKSLLAAADSALQPPRPGWQARLIAAARADSLRIARATEVQRAATGQPAEPTLAFDTVAPIRRDSVSGSLRAEGVLTGNIKRFDARGTAKADHAVVAGNSVASAEASYTVTGVRTPNATLHVEATGDSVHVAGFAFDSASAKIDYTGVRNRGNGRAELAVFQEPNRDYRLDTDFRVELDRKELVLRSLAVQLDSITWRSTQPGTIRWAGDGFTVDALELRSNEGGGRIYASGRVPSDGEADLRLEIDHLHLGNINALLQDTMSIAGVVSLKAHIQGTRAAPRISGDFSADSAMYGATAMPDVRATFSYANTELVARAEAFRNNLRVALADARLPINLALTGVTGSRLIERPLAIDVQADSLPIDALPNFTTAVSDVRGRVRGTWAVRGTWKNADVRGDAFLDLASLKIVPAGILLDDIAGHLRFAGDSAYVDSLVAHSSGGAIRVDGTLDVSNLTRPGFNLRISTRRALALDNDRGRIRADADLVLTGSFDRPMITGTARIVDGVIYAPEMNHRRATPLDLPTLASVVDTATISPDVVVRPNPFLQHLQMDVDLTVDRNTWARNSKGNVEIFTAEDDVLRVNVDQEHATITLFGTITAARGEYTFSGRVFELNSGTATFLGTTEINPLLQLNGQYAVQRPGREALIIQVNVSGNLRGPTVNLASNAQPPLSQSELLSYFAFGQTSSSLLGLEGSGLSGGSGLSAITALAQQQLAGLALGTLTEQAVAGLQKKGTRAGLDVFRIRTATLPEELGFESFLTNLGRGTEVQAGKYVTPRLFFAVNARATNAIPGLRMEYTTINGWSVESTWDLRYMPTLPSLAEDIEASRSRTFGAFVFWKRRF